MYSYFIGKIVSINQYSITVENNYIGYVFYVTNIEDYEVGKIKKFYIFKNSYCNNKNKIVEELYGFIDYSQKDFFLKLLNLTGIGCKTALNICSNELTTLKKLIIGKNSDALSQLPGITTKIANILISELELDDEEDANDEKYNDLIFSLKQLGYSKLEINYAIKNTELVNDLSENISNAIKKIATNNVSTK